MSVTRQQREDLAELVIALTKDSAYPFGGYLRDKVWQGMSSSTWTSSPPLTRQTTLA